MNESNTATVATSEQQDVHVEDKLNVNKKVKDDCESSLKEEKIDTSQEKQANEVNKSMRNCSISSGTMPDKRRGK